MFHDIQVNESKFSTSVRFKYFSYMICFIFVMESNHSENTFNNKVISSCWNEHLLHNLAPNTDTCLPIHSVF